jgi:hypothetical protein
LLRFHREHEKFYASAPRERAVSLQRHARTLHALADHWATAVPSTESPLSPYAGAEDLNDSAALQLEGVLFMEGEGTPAELTHLISDLRNTADEYAQTGDWLANAMRASWDIAAALVDITGLEDLLGERHRIIANDWLAADMSGLIARMLVRAADILDKTDFTPAVLRADLAGSRRAASLLHSTAEIINRAPAFDCRDHQPCRRSVQRVGGSGQRQRAPMARVPRTSSADHGDNHLAQSSRLGRCQRERVQRSNDGCPVARGATRVLFTAQLLARGRCDRFSGAAGGPVLARTDPNTRPRLPTPSGLYSTGIASVVGVRRPGRGVGQPCLPRRAPRSDVARPANVRAGSRGREASNSHRSWPCRMVQA